MTKTYRYRTTHGVVRVHTDVGDTGDCTGYTHAGCGGEIVYNGNYFCEHWRTCGGVMSADEYDEKTGRWGPPALERQAKRFVRGLKQNREGNFRRYGAVEIL